MALVRKIEATLFPVLKLGDHVLNQLLAKRLVRGLACRSRKVNRRQRHVCNIIKVGFPTRHPIRDLMGQGSMSFDMLYPTPHCRFGHQQFIGRN